MSADQSNKKVMIGMIWQEIEKLEGSQLETLAKKKQFVVQEVSDNGVTIFLKSTKKLRKILRSEIEGPYNDLWLSRRLTLSKIRDMHSEANPVYVAAILANTPNIQHSLNPIEIWMDK